MQRKGSFGKFGVIFKIFDVIVQSEASKSNFGIIVQIGPSFY